MISQQGTMSQQRKLDCPICNHSELTNLSDHLIHSHNVYGKKKKTLLRRARFSVLSMQPDQSQQSIPQSDSTPAQFGNSLPKASSLPEQTQYHPTPHQMKMKTN